MEQGALKGVRVVERYLLAYSFSPKLNVIQMLDVGSGSTRTSTRLEGP